MQTNKLKVLVFLIPVAFIFAMSLIARQYDLSELISNFQNSIKSFKITGQTEQRTNEKNANQTVPKAQEKLIIQPSAPSKNTIQKQSQAPTPVPAPTNSWWPAYYSPWGKTIAYKYSHYYSNGCTVPDDVFGCYGGHSVEFVVTEPCTSMSFEFTDDSGVITVGYHTTYVSTGRTFFASTPDGTPLTPGSVSNVVCIP